MRNTPQQDSVGFFNLIGIPHSQANCFEIVALFYLQEFAIDLSNLNTEIISIKQREKISSLIESNKGPFVRVDEPQYGDIMTMKINGIESHVGVYVGAGRFLHSYNEELGSCIDHLKRWGSRVTGYYRLEVEK